MMEKLQDFCFNWWNSTVKNISTFPKRYVENISTAITMINSINKRCVLAILEGFMDILDQKHFISSGGYDFARDILYKSLEKLKLDEVLSKVSEWN